MGTRVTDQVIEEIRARVDIVELIGARMTLKKSGGTFKGCCPFHREKTPSFHVNPVRQTYHCFGCGEHGDVFKFLEKQDGLTFMDAVRMLADRVGVTIQQDTDYNAQNRNLLYAIHAELAAFYQRCLKQTKEAETARTYLTTRKLSNEVVERFGIGFAPTQPRDALLQWTKKHGYTPEQLVSAGILTPPKSPDRPDDYYDRFRGRLMFPICDRQGRVVAFSGRILDVKAHPAKYVNSPETDIFTKSRILYALDKAAAKIVKHPRREAIVCEGQIDVIRCHACGFETAVASQGTAFTKDHVSILKKHADSVVLVFDGDGAGRKAALRTGALFLEAEIPVRVAVLPKGDDPDSLLRDKGPDVFRELLENAVSITTFQVETLRQAETMPDSIDAISRVSHGVLETLAVCPSAVLRSRLLQEAAEHLHLPFSALEEDLEKRREENSRRAAHAAAYHARNDAPQPAAAPATAPSAQADDDRPPLDDALAPDEAPASGDAADALDTPPPAPLPRAERQLCELLMQYETDDAILDAVEHYLPLDILTHRLARDMVGAILESHRSGSDKIAALREALDAPLQPLFDAMVVAEGKMLCAREATPIDAARDLITHLWVQRFKAEQGRLDASSTPDNAERRFAFSMLIKKLETQPWEKACQLMTPTVQTNLTPSLRGVPAGAASAAAAEPSAREADSASGAADPDEFPPSEFPPDETLD
jgi:DNA primase